MADEALQHRLAAAADVAQFVEVAASAGLSVENLDLRPDPVGAARFNPASLWRRDWPGAGWLPAQAGVTPEGAVIDWCHFGGMALTEPFFATSATRALARPFNRLFRTRMTLDDFIAGAPADAPPPDGLIFHLSRCGSTLVAQMLAAVPAHVVLSEPQPLDLVLQLGLPPDRTAAALRAMAGALTRGGADRRFLKLDAWHILKLAAFRDAFPGTPWAFLHRDPTEVMVSQMALRGPQTDPHAFAAAHYGLQDHAAAPAADYTARVLARIAEAALDGLATESIATEGIAIDYRELPDAVFTRLAPHFGFVPTPDERAAMTATTALDPKAQTSFRPARQPPSAQVTEAVATHLAALGKRLVSASSHRSAS